MTFVAALAGAPALPGARCRGRPHLFDEAATGEPQHVVAQRHQQAIGLCLCCSSLDPCRQWLEALPANKKPPGVTAGTVKKPTEKKRGMA